MAQAAAAVPLAGSLAPEPVASLLSPAFIEKFLAQKEPGEPGLLPAFVTNWQSLPPLRILPASANETVLSTIIGPASPNEANPQMVDSFVAGQCVSTYPNLFGNRCGDPIADKYCARILPNRIIFVVTDGCNWGPKPKAASDLANMAFVDYMSKNLADMKDVPEVGHHLLLAVNEAHRKVVTSAPPDEEAGTTTLLGGIITQLADGGVICVCVNIGDCKAFHYSHRSNRVIDITEGNRTALKNAKDPGGRIGPYEKHGGPDLRNLALYCQHLHEGDLLIVASDGIHDNLDPQSLGIDPAQLHLSFPTWESVDDRATLEVKSRFRACLIQQIMSGAEWTPETIARRLIDHCLRVTKPTRDFMQANPTKREPTDHTQFPGKMDHTSALVMRVRPPAPVPLITSADVPIAAATSPPDNTPVSGGHSPPNPEGSPTAGRAAFSGSSSQGNRAGHIAASVSSPPVVPAVQKSRSNTASGEAERIQPTGAASVNLSATMEAPRKSKEKSKSAGDIRPGDVLATGSKESLKLSTKGTKAV